MCTAVGFAASAHASPSDVGDPDTNFAQQLHAVGIYGPRDSNAWIAKIMCKRMYNNLDTTATQTATFVRNQLSRDSTTAQVWQFVGLAVDYYCPDKRVLLDHAA
ncbi:DUF732 domain-containing protein (plasmid) [Mycolicibacterium psychrotolerans]|uniref:DUF732 domain-containing protein n=1 Tax=Mycolicibacterium psychrotolerans TaxID=216929 RepID=UPI003D66DC3C